jgi:hypothetical protein
MASYADWTGRLWTVISSSNVHHVAPGNRLEFQGDGSTRASHKIINKSSNFVWVTSGFTYSSSDKVGETPGDLRAEDGFKYTITRTTPPAPAKPRLTCVGASGGGTWIAEEGG